MSAAMNIQRPGRAGVIALMVAHCAGMIDLVALPVWVGALVAHNRFDPQQAGLLVSLFLAGAVAASLWLAPRLQRLAARSVAAVGFGVAAAGFAALSTQTALLPMAILHVIAGMATGAALSVTHGTIARSPRPQRLFAWVGIALGVFAVVFLGVTPGMVAHLGTPALFAVFGAVMALAALVSAMAFPLNDATAASSDTQALLAPAEISPTAWFGVAGICAMALVQAMTFSFLERVGEHRGFGLQAITGVLIALGLVNLFPAALAAWLEHRLPPRTVLRLGAVTQAILSLIIMTSVGFAPYAAAAAVFAAVMIFTHTFAFGLIARLEPSGRALAATPAMLMTGSAIGPVLGGSLVKLWGYPAVGLAALGVGMVALLCFQRATAMRRHQEALQ